MAPAHFGEWLYDVCWLDYKLGADGTLEYLKRVPLVAECEWGNTGDIHDDFEKLLTARADLKVMIFEAKNLARIGEIAKRLAYLEQRFEMRQAEDRYFLVGRDAEARSLVGMLLTENGLGRMMRPAS